MANVGCESFEALETKPTHDPPMKEQEPLTGDALKDCADESIKDDETDAKRLPRLKFGKEDSGTPYGPAVTRASRTGSLVNGRGNPYTVYPSMASKTSSLRTESLRGPSNRSARSTRQSRRTTNIGGETGGTFEDFQVSKVKTHRPFMNFSDSRFGGTQVSGYDAGRFANITSLRYVFHVGSALRSKEVAMNFVIHLFIAAFVAVCTDALETDAGHMAERGAQLTGEVSGWVVFLLGPYFGILFGRWWTLRTSCLGGFWGNCDDLCMVFSARCKSNPHIRDTIHRWMLAAWSLVELAFTNASEDAILSLMIEEGLLSYSEADLLKGAQSPPQNVLGWILDVLYELVRTGHLQGDMWIFEKKIVDARGAVGYLFAHFDTQVSFGFVHLMAVLIHLSNILSASVVGIASAIAWKEQSHQGWISFSSYLLQHLVRCMFLQGMLVVIADLNDPFGPHINGMPLTQFYNVFDNESTSFMKDEKPTRMLSASLRHDKHHVGRHSSNLFEVQSAVSSAVSEADSTGSSSKEEFAI